MKKTYIAFVAAVFMFAACGGKAAAVKDFGNLFDEGTKEINAIGKALTDAKDGKAVAAAIDKFVGLMKDFREKGEALEKKHSLNAKGEMPPELKVKAEAFQKAAMELGKGPMAQAMMKHASTPEVKAAMEKLKSIR